MFDALHEGTELSNSWQLDFACVDSMKGRQPDGTCARPPLFQEVSKLPAMLRQDSRWREMAKFLESLEVRGRINDARLTTNMCGPLR